MVSRSCCVCVVLMLVVSVAGAQNITTVAGGGPNNLPATASAIGTPWKIVQGNGNTFISDPFSNRVFMVNGKNNLTVVAGNILSGYTLDDHAATSATMNHPQGIAVDSNGNLYIADSGNNAIRFVNVSTQSASLFNNSVTVSAGEIITIAGTGTACGGNAPCGDNGPAASATLTSPGDVFVDANFNIFIADTGDDVIRVVNGQTGVITRVAGNYTACSASPCGDGLAATSAQLFNPAGVWLDSQGDIYIADTADDTVRVVNSQAGPITIAGVTIQSGKIAAIAGSYVPCPVAPCGDGNPGTSSLVQLTNPTSAMPDSNGNVYIGDTQDQVVRVVSSSGTINLVAGTYNTQCSAGPCGDGGAANAAQLSVPTGVWVDGSNNLFIADQNDSSVREIVAPVQGSDNIKTAFGLIFNEAYSGDNNPATQASLFTPSGTTTDVNGNIYIADAQNNAIRVVNTQKSAITVANVSIPAGDIRTVAGTGAPCTGILFPCGDNGPASQAELDGPGGVALDGAGNIYIADSLDSVIREVNAQSGVINTIVGVGNPGFGGDNGPATLATLNAPIGVALDKNGNIYIVDGNNLGPNNEVIRVVNNQARAITVAGVAIQPGTINTVAGTPQTACGSSTSACGDGGPATQAMFNGPTDLALDSSGNMYIADFGDNKVRFVNNSTGVISTIAGTGSPCPPSGSPFCGDTGAATSATLTEPFGVFVDSANNVYVADTGDSVVRKFTLGGDINPIVGSYVYGFFGDGGAATSAALAEPAGLGADFEGNLYVTDVAAFRVREVNRLIVTAPNATLAPNPLVLPDTIVSQDTSQGTITLTNNGNGSNLTVSSVKLSGTNASDFKESDNCAGKTLQADGGNCTITISFTPSAAGTRTASLTITDNAPNNPQIVSISGVGVSGLQILPSSQTVSAGDSATYTITVPSQAFSSAATLSCASGLPTGAACTFGTNPVSPGGTSKLTITTTAPSSASMMAPANKRSFTPLYAVWLLLPAMLLSTAGMSAPNRKKLISYFLLALAIGGVLFLAACGGGSSSGGGGNGGGGTGGTPAGTYTVSVKGVAGTTTSTQTVTLTVQ